MTPIASVIIPAHNAAEFVMNAINSARLQSIANVEIIVVDDGSFDDTAVLVREAQRDDARVQLICHEASLGPSAARNSAISHATGSWLILLDADDTMSPTRIADLVKEAEARGLDLLADNLMLVDAVTSAELGAALNPLLMRQTGLLSLHKLLCADWPGKDRAFRNLGVAKPIIRRAFLAKEAIWYDTTVRLGEDLLFYSCLLASGARFGLTAGCGYRYTTNAMTISRRKVPTMELVDVNEKICCMVSLSSMPEKEQLLGLLKQRSAVLHFQVLTWSLKVGNLLLAVKVAGLLTPLTLVKLATDKVVGRLHRLVLHGDAVSRRT